MARKCTAGISQKATSPTNRKAASNGCWITADEPPHGAAELGHATNHARHAARERRAGPGKRDQERAQVVHDDMLHPVQEEHVLGQILEMGLQHRVDRSARRRRSRQLRQRRRPLLRRRCQEAAQVPPQRQRRGQEPGPGEIPRAPRPASLRRDSGSPPQKRSDDPENDVEGPVPRTGGFRHPRGPGPRSRRLSNRHEVIL